MGIPAMHSEILDAIKEVFSFLLAVFHWISAIAFIIGLLSALGSFEETVNYVMIQWMVPNLIISILTGALMEFLKTRLPSIFRLLKRLKLV